MVENRIKTKGSRGVLAAVALLSLAWISGVASADAGSDRITTRLAGAYEGSRVLENAQHMEMTIFRPASSVAPFGEIQYLVATYPDRDLSVTDFDTVLADGHLSYGVWQIVLQTGNTIHWLRGVCEITAAQFRSVYGDAVAYVAGEGRPVESAYLCQCGAICSRVAVDR